MAKLVAVADAIAKAAARYRQPVWLRGPHDRADPRRLRHRRGGDLHAHRYPCRSDRAVLAAPARRSSAKSRSISTSSASRTASRWSTPTRRTLMVGFNRRFDPHFMAVRAAIDDGEIGAVEMVTIISRDPGAPPVDYIKRSGGIFRDMTIHDFDMARFLLGEEIATVTRAGLGAGRYGHRQGRRFRQRLGDAGDRLGQARHHLQFAPRHLWLRPAHRGAWPQGRGLGREPARRCRSKSPTPRATPARRCTISS